MGSSFGAICDKCGHKFEVNYGGGFIFHLLHCDKCGKEKSILFEEIGEAHLAYLKGLPGPYSIATRKSDKHVQDNYPGKPISEKDYNGVVEKLVGTCSCGGQLTFDAPPRCP